MNRFAAPVRLAALLFAVGGPTLLVSGGCGSDKPQTGAMREAEPPQQVEQQKNAMEEYYKKQGVSTGPAAGTAPAAK